MFNFEQAARILRFVATNNDNKLFELLKEMLNIYEQTIVCRIDPAFLTHSSPVVTALMLELKAALDDPVKSVSATNKLNAVVRDRSLRDIQTIQRQILDICNTIYEENKSTIVSCHESVNRTCKLQLTKVEQEQETLPEHVLFFIQLPAKLAGIKRKTGTSTLITKFEK